MSPLVLCADDYAQSPAISAGIRALVRWGCLRAVSCMSSSPHWPQEGELLKAARDGIDTGLHFDLTHSFENCRPSLAVWLVRSRSGGIDPRKIRDEFLRQWDRFTAVMGGAPDHLDGHQHVHLLPGVREGIRQALDELGHILPVRRIDPPVEGANWKHRLALRLTAGAEAVFSPFPRNTAFAGFRRFSHRERFSQMLQGWMDRLPAGGLIMCHPGHDATDPRDPIQSCRAAEYEYLASRAFEAQHGRLKRFSELARVEEVIGGRKEFTAKTPRTPSF